MENNKCIICGTKLIKYLFNNEIISCICQAADHSYIEEYHWNLLFSTKTNVYYDKYSIDILSNIKENYSIINMFSRETGVKITTEKIIDHVLYKDEVINYIRVLRKCLAFI